MILMVASRKVGGGWVMPGATDKKKERSTVNEVFDQIVLLPGAE
jgi:hypothetical protein